MFLRCRFFLLLLIFSFSVCQGACAQTQSFLPNDILISLEPGYSVFSDTWVAASQETVFLLIGNEDENEMRLAIAEQSSDGVYQVIAQSKKIISYEEYRVGHVEMMDKWDTGVPYFGYECEQSRNVYLSLSDTGDNNWEICYGHIKSDEVDFNFSYVITESESELIVYETLFPQIYWPATTSMSLDDFDLSVVEKESITALKYLDCFQETHQFGDQDATYRIIWEESMQ